MKFSDRTNESGVRELSELKERRSFSDIIGGIGFIVGLLGAVFFFSARKAAKTASSSKDSPS